MMALDTAADVFEASPRQSFTNDEVVRTLRALKSEMYDPLVVAAYEIAVSDTPIPLPLSQPS